MTELERQVEAGKCQVALAELELQKAELKLSHGGRHLAEAKETYGELKIAVETAKVKLRQERSWLAKIETDAAKGFVDDPG